MGGKKWPIMTRGPRNRYDISFFKNITPLISNFGKFEAHFFNNLILNINYLISSTGRFELIFSIIEIKDKSHDFRFYYKK